MQWLEYLREGGEESPRGEAHFGNFLRPVLSKPAVSSEENSFSKPDSLPPPPDRRRFLGLFSLMLVGVAALFVAALLIPAARYALTGGEPRNLGALAEAQLDQAGEWVEGHGMPHQDAWSFRRRGSSGSFRLTRLVEADHFWLVLPVPAGAHATPSEGSPITPQTYVPPSRFSGRLVRVGDAGPTLAPLVDLVQSQGGSTSDYLLLEGDSPRSYQPLLALCLVLAVLGVGCLSFAARLRTKPA